MNILSHILAAAAVMDGAVIYGTDVFCAIVQRPALAHVDEGALTSVMGRVHEYGDRRLPLPRPETAGDETSFEAALTAVITLHSTSTEPCPSRIGPAASFVTSVEQ